MALATLGVLGPAELASALATEDKAMVARAGRRPEARRAHRRRTEGQSPAFASIDSAGVRLAGEDDAKTAPKPVQDAISALINLGYGRPQAAAAVAASGRLWATPPRQQPSSDAG